MTERSCMNCKHTYHSEICRECCVGVKFAPRPNAPQPNKQLAELLNLRKRVRAQREEILRLQGGKEHAMTVRDLWLTTTNDLYLVRGDQLALKLPTGGRLQVEHAELIVQKIEIQTRASEAPCLLVWTREAE